MVGYNSDFDTGSGLDGLENDLRQLGQQLDADEQAVQQAEADLLRISREKKGDSTAINAALAAVTSAERKRDRTEKTYSRTESQVLQARRQLGTRTANTGPVTREMGGAIIERDPTGAWKEVYRDPYQEGARKLAESQASIRLSLEQQKISLEQAQTALVNEQKRLEFEADQEWRKQQSEATKRGQDISMRGQDLGRQSDVERNAGSLATAGTSATMNALPFMVPRGDMANFDKSIANMGKGTVPTYGPSASTPFPFDPSQLPMQLFAQMMAQQSPAAAQMAGVPMTEPRGYRAPGGPIQLPSWPPPEEEDPLAGAG